MILQQFHPDLDDDYIRIYDVNDDGTSTMIASLTGPQSIWQYGDWQKKIISSTNKNMLVEFISNGVWEFTGFSVFIHYSPLPSKECEKGLDMITKTIQSPNYPDLYNNNLDCKWLISAPYGSHIILEFLQFDVRFLVILISDLFSHHFNRYFSPKLEVISCSGTCGVPSWKGDNICDDENNNCGCEWDGGDCCGSNVNTQYCSACECLDPNIYMLTTF